MSITIEQPPVADVPVAAGRRAIKWRGRVIPVIGPNWRDPRLHLALIIVSVLTIGTALLDFRLSIIQIVVPVVVCGLIESGYRLITTGALMWPASGMQTATSTVLVVRAVGTRHGDWWSTEGLHWFVAVAVFGLLTKYVIRTSRGHIFNPSNIALVLAFLVLGSDRIEPLDFWWGGFDWSMALMYAVITVGGVTLCRRLGLLGMAVAFWVTFACGMALLAGLGHSITTRWSFSPVEGWRLWRTIVLSPETLVFLLFMITDPKTTPRGRVARASFGFAVGVVSTLLIAPWPTEYGAKVGLLAGLVVMGVLRPLLARLAPEPGAEDDRLAIVARRVAVRPALLVGVTAAVAVAATGIALAGMPNRNHATFGIDPSIVEAAQRELEGAADRIDRPAPRLTIGPGVAGLSQSLASEAGALALVDALYFNLDVEAEAIATGDESLLVAVDHGQRLLDVADMTIAGDTARTVPHYSFDTVDLGVAFPGGFQSGPNAAVTVTGTLAETTLGPTGEVVDERAGPIEITFTMRQTPTGQWLTTGTL